MTFAIDSIGLYHAPLEMIVSERVGSVFDLSLIYFCQVVNCPLSLTSAWVWE
jgi:hypothetical protein